MFKWLCQCSWPAVFLFHLHLTVLLFHDYKEEFGVCFRTVILIFCVSVWKSVWGGVCLCVRKWGSAVINCNCCKETCNKWIRSDRFFYIRILCIRALYFLKCPTHPNKPCIPIFKIQKLMWIYYNIMVPYVLHVCTQYILKFECSVLYFCYSFLLLVPEILSLGDTSFVVHKSFLAATKSSHHRFLL